MSWLRKWNTYGMCQARKAWLAWWVTIFFSFQTCKTVCATGALPQPESSESSGEQTDRPCDLLGFGLLSWNSNLLIKIYYWLIIIHTYQNRIPTLNKPPLNFQFWYKPLEKRMQRSVAVQGFLKQQEMLFALDVLIDSLSLAVFSCWRRTTTVIRRLLTLDTNWRSSL